MQSTTTPEKGGLAVTKKGSSLSLVRLRMLRLQRDRRARVSLIQKHESMPHPQSEAYTIPPCGMVEGINEWEAALPFSCPAILLRDTEIKALDFPPEGTRVYPQMSSGGSPIPVIFS